MAKRSVPPADTALADFRETARLTPPPRTLSNAASRLVDLLDEFLYSLQCGWDMPPGFPRDRFVPTVYGRRDLVVPIVQYLDDFGFTGDARRLHEAARLFYAHRDWKLMTPSPGDDKGWKEFQQLYVNPLVHLAGCLRAVICETRQLIIATATNGGGADAAQPTPVDAQPAGDGQEREVDHASQHADTERILEGVLLAAGGDDAPIRAVMVIANDGRMTAERKMVKILLDATNRRFEALSSDQWGRLLGVKGSAVRKTDAWTKLQEAKRTGQTFAQVWMHEP